MVPPFVDGKIQLFYHIYVNIIAKIHPGKVMRVLNTTKIV